MMRAKDEADRGKPTIDLLLATKAIIDRDIELGLVSEDRMRLTIQARQEQVKGLAAQGMSQRKIAKALGVSKDTVGGDLGKRKRVANKSPDDGDKVATVEQESAVSAYPTEIHGDDSPDNYRAAYLLRADQARSFAVFPFDKIAITVEIVNAANLVVSAWQEVIKNLETKL